MDSLVLSRLSIDVVDCIEYTENINEYHCSEVSILPTEETSKLLEEIDAY